jgi:hypothetical protein
MEQGAGRGFSLSPLGGERESEAPGGSGTLLELFAAAGFRFDFSAATIKPLIQLVSAEMGRRLDFSSGSFILSR